MSDVNFRKNLSKVLTDYMRDNEISYSEIARRTGVDRKKVSKIIWDIRDKADVKEVTLNTIINLSTGLGIPINNFFIDNLHAYSDRAILFRQYMSLRNKNTKKQAVFFIKSLMEQ